MDIPQSRFSGQGPRPDPAPVTDPRLLPTPDFGTLGPDSDFSTNGPISIPVRKPLNPQRLGPVFAAAIGVLLAVLTANVGTARAAWSSLASLFSASDNAPQNAGPNTPVSAKDSHQLDRLKPQKQAEALLELAVSHNDAAVDQISSRVEHWQGKVKWDSQIATLTTAALNSNDLRVRESGIEVE